MKGEKVATRKGAGGPPSKVEARIAQLRKAAARHRERAEEFYALARDCRAHADHIMFEECGRRELEACGRLERCAERNAKAARGRAH